MQRTLFALAALLFMFAADLWAQQEGPSRNALSAAERYVSQFELQAERANGAPFEPGHDAKQAMQRVAALQKEFPDDPAVQDLFARVRQALLASRGEVFQITPQMVAYREAQNTLVARLEERAEAAWAAMLGSEEGSMLEQAPLPAPDAQRVSIASLAGRMVVLEGLFDYPARQFTSAGRSYLAVGKPSEGFYYVDLSGPAWLTAYRALREYQSQVTADTPGPWTLAGRITGIDMMVPDAGEESRMAPAFGWVVEPVALRVAGRTAAFARTAGEDAHFAGQAELEAMKAEFYTVTDVAPDADAMAVMAAYVAAIKERNWDLYLELIDDSWKVTDRSRERLRYYWDITQRRLRDLYVHVEPVEVVAEAVIQGEKIDDLESVFLTDDDVAELTARSEPLVEQATVRVVRYDERGVQVEPDNRITLRRTEDGPWRVYGPWPL